MATPRAQPGHRLAVSGGGGSFVVHYGAGSPFDPTTIVLSDFSDCAADFNHDNILDPDDLADYITAYFALPPAPGSDFNADGITDPDDLADYIGAFFSSPC